MNKHFIQVTNGLLPIALLALLAVALIAGQARARSPVATGFEAAPTSAPAASVVISADMLRKAESLPVLVNALTTLPAGFEFRISLPGDVSAGHDQRDRSAARH